MPKLKRGRVILAALVLALALFGCGAQESQVTVDRGSSFYMEYDVDEGGVFMRCYVTLVNPGPNERQVALLAVARADAAHGLLVSPYMDTPGRFTVPARGSASFEVSFRGQHGGGTKRDRLLPHIIVIDAAQMDYTLPAFALTTQTPDF